MRANLDAAGGLPLAEHVTALLAPAMGRLAAHDLVAAAAARAAAADATAARAAAAAATATDAAAGRGTLVAALLADEAAAAELAAAGIGRAELENAVDPARYLGAAQHFIDRALAAHRAASASA